MFSFWPLHLASDAISPVAVILIFLILIDMTITCFRLRRSCCAFLYYLLEAIRFFGAYWLGALLLRKHAKVLMFDVQSLFMEVFLFLPFAVPQVFFLSLHKPLRQPHLISNTIVCAVVLFYRIFLTRIKGTFELRCGWLSFGCKTFESQSGSLGFIGRSLLSWFVIY